MYRYRPVHTSTYLHKLSYHNIMSVHTSTDQYVRVHTRTNCLVCVKKNCKLDSNQQSSAYCSQNRPLHYWGTDLNAGMLAGLYVLYIYLVNLTRLVRAPGV